MQSAIILGVGAALTAAAASAQVPVDKYQSVALVSGQYQSAMAGLEAQLRADPRDESVMLNLAMAYRHAGRIEQSNALYRRVLAQDDYVLNATDGSGIGAHDLAQRGLLLNAAMIRTASR